MTAAVIKLEVRERFQTFARQHAPKKLAAVADISHRTAQKWRAGGMPCVPSFIAMARKIPELRAMVIQWLAAENELSPDLDRLSNGLMKALEHIEEARGRKVFNPGGNGDDGR